MQHLELVWKYNHWHKLANKIRKETANYRHAGPRLAQPLIRPLCELQPLSPMLSLRSSFL